jgi:hypothetical protein
MNRQYTKTFVVSTKIFVVYVGYDGIVRNLLTITAFSIACLAQAPSTDVLKQVLEKQLLALTPEGVKERQVLYQSVAAAPKNGAFYPFRVTALIRDYGAGYPKNSYFGETCIGKMDGWVFNLSRSARGEWAIDGRMTVTDGKRCEKNPAAGVSSIPLATLQGTAAAAGKPAPAAPGQIELHIGEWACYGTGGRLMAGMGFRLQPGGGYVDLDGKRAGRYTHNKSAGSIAFQGGFLDGQTGRDLKGQSFNLSNTVSCEPWR